MHLLGYPHDYGNPHPSRETPIPVPGQHDKIYIVDFGLAKYFRGADGRHIPMVKKSGMTGTARYTTDAWRF